jgi:hypothetical protein
MISYLPTYGTYLPTCASLWPTYEPFKKKSTYLLFHKSLALLDDNNNVLTRDDGDLETHLIFDMLSTC